MNSSSANFYTPASGYSSPHTAIISQKYLHKELKKHSGEVYMQKIDFLQFEDNFILNEDISCENRNSFMSSGLIKLNLDRNLSKKLKCT
jgi:hypothetical protein